MSRCVARLFQMCPVCAIFTFQISHTLIRKPYLTLDRLFKLQLLDVVYREETLVNVIRSVTKNGRSILLTAVLAVILIYLFSIVGFIFFKDDFLIEVESLDNVVNKGK